MTRALFHRLRRDRRGATIVEFAIVAPVMMMLIMGVGDLLYQSYAQAILSGAVQKAGRDSSIEGAPVSTIDGRVSAAVRLVARNATFNSSRKNYDTFTAVAPEPFTDTNGNGIRDVGECFSDVNGNKQWDADPGATGQGGANAVALYTMTVTYPRMFPFARLFGANATQTISASTLLKNQPYDNQATTTPKTVC